MRPLSTRTAGFTDSDHLIRFHFAKRDDTLNAALDRLSELDRKAKDYLR